MCVFCYKKLGFCKFWKEGNVLFNDTTHFIFGYRERKPHFMGIFFKLTARDLLYAPSNKQDIPVVGH